ncbi:hypothetical protein HY311_03030 [Candidatus Nomurabacteria bacterium]|nr:hypothetical protein [Candidatus Nomurabacteria bacterium]
MENPFKKKVQKIELSENLPEIPKETVEGWKKIEVRECGEPLVPLGAFSDDDWEFYEEGKEPKYKGFTDCDTSSAYFGERGYGHKMNFLEGEVDRRVSLITHFVRKGVAEKLLAAQELLPEGYYFRFYDTYRPLSVQQALFDEQKAKFKIAHPEWDEATLDSKTQNYVSLPSPNTERGTTHPSPHSTGGAVDLTIIKMDEQGKKRLADLNKKMKKGELNKPVGLMGEAEQIKNVEEYIERQGASKKWSKEKIDQERNTWLGKYRFAILKAQIFRENCKALKMGVGFDFFGDEAGMRYFEDLAQQRELTLEEKEAQTNRRFLYQILKKVGISNYPEEWWHFMSGDNMDAANTKKPYAIYSGAPFSKENIECEEARRRPYIRALQGYDEFVGPVMGITDTPK